MQPLLIGYVISGWVTLFLVYGLVQKNAVLYKKYFPYFVLVVTALQGISSEARYGNGFSETFGFNRFNLEEGPRQLNRKQVMAHLS